MAILSVTVDRFLESPNNPQFHDKEIRRCVNDIVNIVVDKVGLFGNMGFCDKPV